jgi:hypothetical protein
MNPLATIIYSGQRIGEFVGFARNPILMSPFREIGVSRSRPIRLRTRLAPWTAPRAGHSQEGKRKQPVSRSSVGEP